MLPAARFPGGAIGAAAVAEQLFEHGARVVLHRQRLRRRPPANGMRVGAAQNSRAGAGVGRRIHRQLERRDLCLVGEVPREQLVHRHIGDHLDFVAPAPRRSGQKRSRCAGMDVVPVRAQPGKHEHLVAKRRQRLEDGRQLERAPVPFRRPVLHRHPVRNVEGLEPVHRCSRGARRRRQRREHRVEKRQRDGRPQSPQHGAARQRS